MNTENYPTALSALLDQLADDWEAGAYLDQIRIFRWKVKTENYRVIETFVERESSEAGVLPHIFIRFETAFQFADQYGKELQQAFRAMVHEDRKWLEEEGLEMKWEGVKGQQGTHTSQYLVNELSTFARINELEESLLVAFLVPKEIADVDAWKNWVVDAGDSGIPANVRLLIVDTEEEPIFEELSQQNSLFIYSSQPNLDLEAVMEELAAMGDKNDPGVQYRMAFVRLTQAAGKADWKGIRTYSGEASTIARKENWPHLVATVHMTVAGAETQDERYEDARENYQKALDEALVGQKDIEGQDEYVRMACGKVAIQALLGQGTAYIAVNEYTHAAHTYEMAATYAKQFEGEEGPPPEEMDSQYALYCLEAWRMAAYCREAEKQYQEAWECNEKALEAGSKLNEQSRMHSTLPYVGQALLRLTQKTGNHDQHYPLEERLNALLGEGWEEKVAQRS